MGALTLGVLGLNAPDAHAGAIRTNPGFSTNELPANDDQSTGLVNIGFNVNFFGTTYSQLYVNNNGNITFDQRLREFTPFDLTSTNTPIIAPFFADVDTRGAGSQTVRYGQTFGTSTVNGHRAFGVNYINVGYFASNDDKLNSFQVILIDRSDTGAGNFDIEFNYDKIQWETGDASDGTNGLGGDSARAGFSNGSGDPGTFFEISGSAVNGAFLDSNTRTGLIYNSINSDVPGRYFFGAREGDVTRTLSIGDATVTEGNSGTVNADFTVTLSPASDANVTVAYATANNTATAPGDYTAKSGTLTFTPGQTTKTISVVVKGDTVIEPDETFFVNLSSPSGSGVTLGDGQGLGTIINDDVNNAPTVANIAASTNEDTTLTFTAAIFDAKFTDADGQTLQSVRVDTLPANGTLKLSGTNVTVNQVIPRASLGNLTFVPALNFNGAASFKYNASDGTNFAATNATVNITVVAVNDAPSFTVGANQTVAFNAGAQSVTGFATAISPGPANESGQTVTFIVTNDNNALFLVQPAISSDGTLTYNSAANASGVATVTVKIKDNGGVTNGGVDTSAAQTFTITVTRGNQPPSVRPTIAPTNPKTNQTVTVTPNGSDAENDALTFTYTFKVNGVQKQTGSSASFNLSVAGNGDVGDTVSATVVANDGTSDSAPMTVTVTVANSAPSLANASYSGTVGAAFSQQLGGGDDDMTQTLTYSVMSGALPGGLMLSSSGLISGTPTTAGTFNAMVKVSDGTASATASISFVIAPTPVPSGAFIVDNQTLSASQGRTFSYTLQARGEAGDVFTWSVAPGSSLPPGVVLSSAGVLSGTPANVGTFFFSLRISNGTDVVTASYILIVTTRVDGVGPVVTRSDVQTPTTRDALAASTLSGTVRDIAPGGVTPSGVRRMFVQLRRGATASPIMVAASPHG